MKMTQSSSVGLERLSALIAKAEAADPALARRNALFAKHLRREQQMARQRIMENPDSMEARDFNFAFKPCYS